MKIKTYHECRIEFEPHEAIRVVQTAKHLINEGYFVVTGYLNEDKVIGVHLRDETFLLTLRSRY